MLRRDIAALRVAHQLDSERRDLYVEGQKEVRFLRYLAGLPSEGGQRVFSIDTVDVPGVAEGGNRGRILTLGDQVGDVTSIRGLVDADNDLIISAPLPANVWRTDGRDLECYLLREDSFEKLGVSAGFDQAEGAVLLGQIVRVSRLVAAVRIVSARERLELPFQRTRLQRSVKASSRDVELDLERYVGTLLQNASRSLSELSDLCATIREADVDMRSEPDIAVVSGKDALEVLDLVLRAHGSAVGSGALWVTLERTAVIEYPNLHEVVTFLSG